MSNLYSNYPKVTFNFSTFNLSYTDISYSGNTITTGSINTIRVYDNSYTSPDLSFNTLYTFTFTSYNSSNVVDRIQNTTVDTTPSVSGVYTGSISNTISNSLVWYGTYDYIKLNRAYANGKSLIMTGNTYIGGNIYTNSYIDTDMCGNTTYKYKIVPFIGNVEYTSSDTITIYTVPQTASDLSAIFIDSSSIKVSFKEPKNSYTNSLIYNLRTYDNVYVVSGSSSPLHLTNLTNDSTYIMVIDTSMDGLYNVTSKTLTVTLGQSKLIWYKFNIGDSVYNSIKDYGIYNGYDASATSNYLITSRITPVLGTGCLDLSQNNNNDIINNVILYMNKLTNISSEFSSNGWYPSDLKGYTFTVWAYSDSWSSGPIFTIKTSNNNNYYICVFPSQRISFGSSNFNSYPSIITNKLKNNNWTLFALVFQPNSMTQNTVAVKPTFYQYDNIDKEHYDITPQVSNDPPLRTYTNGTQIGYYDKLYIGSGGIDSRETAYVNNQYFKGYIDDFRMYDTALTADQISSIFNKTS